MGANDVDDLKCSIRRNIQRIHKHENYQYSDVESWMTNDFDIAILQLDKAVTFGHNIQPICLPQSSRIDYTGKLVTAIGLCKIGTISKRTSRSKAQQAHIQIWTNEQCGKLPEYTNKLTNNMMCAGDYENATLRAYIRNFDFGQLVIENEHGSMELVGIYSFGHRSGLYPGTPPVFTRVANFLPWIQSKMTDQCMCASKNIIRNNSSEKLETSKNQEKLENPKEQTDLSLQPVKNGSCACGNYS
ncbi:transmembrane protease serine 11F-like [Sitodiplosis mosellana]|uniref:transmembrane protease serine 11F-like n=1 Tax=Sitodiplosis mosellana TaxID=263140 RepID=UPI0024440FF6|nr:transmembrane protease serine 11F-like [Sitodiplosis mosellana]XP_055308363.1 transmembrane protease serine 11F-like [Sitodiplosis mosellana]XP_055308364.1 transmembrane protease serine 11F-like [Sitodiplosis mosellana]